MLWQGCVLNNITANFVAPTQGQQFIKGDKIRWTITYSGLIPTQPLSWFEFGDIDSNLFDAGNQTIKAGYGAIQSVNIMIKEIIYQKSSRGRIALYRDITSADSVNIYFEANRFKNPILTIDNNEIVDILEERVEGEYIKNYTSIWHKVGYKNISGYILSSFIDLEDRGRVDIINKINTYSNNFDVDKNVVTELARCESRFKPYARSYVDAKGIYQLMTITVKDINNRLGGQIDDPYNPDQNIDGGLRYLEWLYQYYKGSGDDLGKTIAAWNWGIGHVSKNEPLIIGNLPLETQGLIKCVLGD